MGNRRTMWKRLPTIPPTSLARNSYKPSLSTAKLRKSHGLRWTGMILILKFGLGGNSELLEIVLDVLSERMKCAWPWNIKVRRAV